FFILNDKHVHSAGYIIGISRYDSSNFCHYAFPPISDASVWRRMEFSRIGAPFTAFKIFFLSFSRGKINKANAPVSKFSFAIGISAGSPESRYTPKIVDKL